MNFEMIHIVLIHPLFLPFAVLEIATGMFFLVRDLNQNYTLFKAKMVRPGDVVAMIGITLLFTLMIWTGVLAAFNTIGMLDTPKDQHVLGGVSLIATGVSIFLFFFSMLVSFATAPLLKKDSRLARQEPSAIHEEGGD